MKNSDRVHFGMTFQFRLFQFGSFSVLLRGMSALEVCWIYSSFLRLFFILILNGFNLGHAIQHFVSVPRERGMNCCCTLYSIHTACSSSLCCGKFFIRIRKLSTLIMRREQSPVYTFQVNKLFRQATTTTLISSH